MKRAAAIFPAMALAALSGAQGHAKEMSEADSARSSVRRVLACVVEDDLRLRDGRTVARALTFELPPEGTPWSTEDALARVAFHRGLEQCIYKESYDGRAIKMLAMPVPIYRGQIARALVLKLGAGRHVRTIRTQFAGMTRFDPANPNYPMQSFGLCVAKLDPANSERAVAGKVAGAEEAAAYQALAPAFARCVAPGQTIRFSKSVLEGALSEGLLAVKLAGDPATDPPRP